jgi:hypothetical protein
MNQEKLSSLFTTMSEISGKKLCKEMEFLHLKGNNSVGLLLSQQLQKFDFWWPWLWVF